MRGFLIFFIAINSLGLNATAKPANRPPALLFDDWAPAETTEGVTKNFGDWKSPSEKYSIAYLKSGQDQDDFTLVGKNHSDENSTVLCYGNRGAGVTWYGTKMGDIAVIDYTGDPDHNALYVILAPNQKEKTSWTLLYSTPALDLGADHFVELCYWSVLKVDPNMGSIRLKASWNYSDVTNAQRKTLKTEGIYNVPLFYGYK